MLDRFEFETRFSNVNYGKACRALRRERGRVNGFWRSWGFFATSVIGLAVLAGSVWALTDGNLGGTIGYAIIMGGLFALIFRWSRKAQVAIKEAPTRSGVTRVSLTPEGYGTHHPGQEGLVRWSHVTGVLTTPDALLILHSPYEYYPIEAVAFDGPDHMDSVAKQIKSWIEAAKSAA